MTQANAESDPVLDDGTWYGTTPQSKISTNRLIKYRDEETLELLFKQLVDHVIYVDDPAETRML